MQEVYFFFRNKSQAFGISSHTIKNGELIQPNPENNYTTYLS